MSLVKFEGGTGYFVCEGPCIKGLVVVQEWWGLNQHMKDMAHRFAKEGLCVLVPDLYHGRFATDKDEATHLFNNLDWTGAVKEIEAAAAFLKSKGVQQVGITGFCMGGALTAAAAVLANGFTAAAPFYGIPPPTFCDLSKTKIPVQGHFGLQDTHEGFADPETAQQYEKQLQNAGVEHEVLFYDADHAFMNATRPEVFSQDNANLAFGRVVSFMDSKLG
ncbi:hypothetical protein H4R34_004236 [Dimargaris verticillata]|uniref:Dienelactone hydrolase domain-containing protein n=1 Tax=Dimargaris verticillata TaxID=2761393 RepID=A0A9W8EBB9_9FUNG|nr:hypothetical protein H4R34_004236 [Dimargaris verticillata]